MTPAPTWQASLFDLLAAYARQRQTQALSRVTVQRRAVWSLAEAREILERLIGPVADWLPLDAYLSDYLGAPETRRMVRASTFSAMLEMVREGRLVLQQERAFAPLWVRGGAVRTAEAG